MNTLLNENAVAYCLQTTPSKVKRWVKTAGLRAVVLPDGEYLIDRADLQLWVSARKVPLQVEEIK
jgi:hypothetical protein